MFIHNFKYMLKTLFRNKMLIFWTFMFPIILGTFFKMAFSNIEKSEKLDVIDIAFVGAREDSFYAKAFKGLSEGDDRLFNTKFLVEDEAKKLLDSKKISGYVLCSDDELEIVVYNSGINETVLKSVVDEIVETKMIIENKIKQEITNNPNLGGDIEDLQQLVQEKVEKLKSENFIKDISNKNISYTMIEYYTLIAMTCLYGGILGMTVMNKSLANMSEIGKRISITPLKKSVIVVSGTLAAYFVQLIGLGLLFIYTIFVLKVQYGNNLSLIILLSVLGSFVGLVMGVFIASVSKVNENTKLGIIIAVTMLGCFFSGMMGITMKYVVDKNMPLINKINPANMITDGFYSLYYYSTLDRYMFNILSLGVLALVLLSISIVFLRREAYDSI